MSLSTFKRLFAETFLLFDFVSRTIGIGFLLMIAFYPEVDRLGLNVFADPIQKNAVAIWGNYHGVRLYHEQLVVIFSFVRSRHSDRVCG